MQSITQSKCLKLQSHDFSSPEEPRDRKKDINMAVSRRISCATLKLELQAVEKEMNFEQKNFFEEFLQTYLKENNEELSFISQYHVTMIDQRLEGTNIKLQEPSRGSILPSTLIVFLLINIEHEYENTSIQLEDELYKFFNDRERDLTRSIARGSNDAFQDVNSILPLQINEKKIPVYGNDTVLNRPKVIMLVGELILVIIACFLGFLLIK